MLTTRQTVLRALPFVVLFVCVAVFVGSQPPIMNNGDYWRTALETMKFPFMRPLRWDCFPVLNDDVNWSSTISIIYFAQVKTAHLMGFECFSLRFMFMQLTALYLAGAVLFILLSSKAWAAAVMALIPVVLFGEFFGSIYEDGRRPRIGSVVDVFGAGAATAIERLDFVWCYCCLAGVWQVSKRFADSCSLFAFLLGVARISRRPIQKDGAAGSASFGGGPGVHPNSPAKHAAQFL